MSQAYLTIDDVPAANFREIIGWLRAHGIPAVLFASDAFTGSFRDSLLEALDAGFIIGNHSMSHPHFSELCWDDCVREIESMEDFLNELYCDAKVQRRYKLFRFPYFDKGGANMERLQRYLREHDFVKLDDRALSSKGYRARGWDKDIDTACSFDCAEYLLPGSLELVRQFHADHKALDMSDVMRKMKLPDETFGDTLLEKDDRSILLLHAHDKTEALFPRYWEQMLLYLLNHGMEFLEPAFIDAEGVTVQ